MSAILIALNSSNELVSLVKTFSTEELAALKNKQRYFCPGCGSDVLLKAGEVKIPHFAHRSLANCDAFSEPETPLHLHGKLQLHYFFSQHTQTTELEKYLPSIKQRADLLVNNQIAIEFQCSTISAGQVRSRTEGYQSIAIKPLWILGPRFSPTDGIQIIQLKHFEREMIQRSNGVDYLLSFCPETNDFIYASGLFWLGGNRWAAKLKSLPANAQSLPFAVPKKLTCEEYKAIFQLTMAQRDAFIRSQQYMKNRYRNPFWVLTYELRLNHFAIPSYIGIPFARARLIEEPPIIWQMRVIKVIQDGAPLESLLQGSCIKLAIGVETQEAMALLEDYASIYKKLNDEKHADGKILEVLYAHYCKSG